MNKKTCKDCGDKKDLSEFHQNSRTRDGVLSKCKRCTALKSVEYYEVKRKKLRAQEIKDMNGPKYEYRTRMFTILQILKLKKCHCSPSYLSRMLKLGKTVKEIIEVKKCNSCKQQVALNQFNKNKSKHDGMAGECKSCVSHLRKGTNIAKAPSIETTKANKIFKAARTIAEEKRQIAIKIMSVPVNPKKTQEYYMMLNFTPRSMSNLGAVEQVSKASETAEREKYRA